MSAPYAITRPGTGTIGISPTPTENWLDITVFKSTKSHSNPYDRSNPFDNPGEWKQIPWSMRFYLYHVPIKHGFEFNMVAHTASLLEKDFVEVIAKMTGSPLVLNPQPGTYTRLLLRAGAMPNPHTSFDSEFNMTHDIRTP